MPRPKTVSWSPLRPTRNDGEQPPASRAREGPFYLTPDYPRAAPGSVLGRQQAQCVLLNISAMVRTFSKSGRADRVGTPKGLVGPRTRAAIRDWQQSRGASPTGHPELPRRPKLYPPSTPASRVGRGSTRFPAGGDRLAFGVASHRCRRWKSTRRTPTTRRTPSWACAAATPVSVCCTGPRTPRHPFPRWNQENPQPTDTAAATRCDAAQNGGLTDRPLAAGGPGQRQPAPAHASD